MRGGTTRRALLAAGIAAALAGCAPSGGGRMVPVAAPDGWQEAVEAFRAERDAYFREDPESPLLADDRPGFAGLTYWPLDPALRLVGPLHRYARPERSTMITTAGRPRPSERYGWLSFVYRNEVCVLQVYRLLDSEPGEGAESLFLPFIDGTTGTETYPAGRYVKLREAGDGRYVLDFNMAHNPSCAYGDPERFACPVTPAANRLPMRIEAGERGFRAPPAESAGRAG